VVESAYIGQWSTAIVPLADHRLQGSGPELGAREGRPPYALSYV